jgi:hypothetical protein
VATSALGAPGKDGVGLLSPQITGLPVDLFARSRPERLLTLIADMRPSDLPALQDLALVLLLAESTPPPVTGGMEALLQARSDRLVAFGALDQAQALLELAGSNTPTLFGKWFEISLLTGNDDAACAALRDAPSLAPSLSARVFCLSRGDDWAGAFLTLETARAIGAIPPADAELLAYFLDPEAFEGTPVPVVAQMDALRYRLLDGLGEPPATAALPLPFAASDLRENIGWKAQIEAAERLTRAQAISPERLRALYTERKPAASGGVWDRAGAVQALEAALEAVDPGAIANTLPAAWVAMSSAGLQVPFAELYGGQLAKLPLAPAASQLALKIQLLSQDFAMKPAPGVDPRLPRDIFALNVALGRPLDARGLDAVAQAIAVGLTEDELPEPFNDLFAQGRLGEALLRALALLQDGAQSDPGDIAATLALLRAAGLETTARRTALQLLLLERPA